MKKIEEARLQRQRADEEKAENMARMLARKAKESATD
jgi:hypothetical protein